jgi:hypothetical protein
LLPGVKTFGGLGNFLDEWTNHHKVIRNSLPFHQHSEMADSSGSVAPEPSSLARAMANEVGIERDMEQLSKFVREKLFGFMVHDLKNKREDVLSDTGVPCQTFIKYFVSPMHSVNNVHVLDVPEEDLRQYIKFLWKKGLSDKGKGNIRKNLNQEKSAVYAAVENCFKSK